MLHVESQTKIGYITQVTSYGLIKCITIHKSGNTTCHILTSLKLEIQDNIEMRL